MSGGPVLNETGQVIGIHGKGDTDTTRTKATANPNVVLKTGFNLAIPINTYLSLASQAGIPGFVAPAAKPASAGPTADDLFLQAVAKYDSKDFKGAIADFTQAIRLNPQDAFAFVSRGVARLDLGDKQGAIADFTEAIRLNPQDAEAYYGRGFVRSELGDRQGAIADFQKGADLARAQGNNALYELAVGNLRKLQQ